MEASETVKGFTKYNDEVLRIATEYVESKSYPLLERIALLLDINYDTLVEWRKKYKKFNEICTKALLKQKSYILEGTLDGGVNVIGGIFQLKANHGMKDNPDEHKDTNITVNTISYRTEDQLKKKLKTIAVKKLKTLKDDTSKSHHNDT